MRLSTPDNENEITATVHRVMVEQGAVPAGMGAYVPGHKSMTLELTTAEAPVGAFGILTIETETWAGEGIMTSYDSHAGRRTKMVVMVTKGEM